MVFHDRVKGVVLAGGEGKRLRPLSYYLQKCMIPIGERQRPLLDYVIRLLRYHGVTDVTMLVGYKSEQIRCYFDDGARFGVDLTYLQDDPTIKGTGAALLNLYHNGPLDSDGSVLIYYGDILSNIDLREMLTQHEETGAAATLALARGYNVPVGVAKVKGDSVVSWAEKPAMDIHVGIGILALDAKVLGELPSLVENRRELDIMGDLIPYLLGRGDSVRAYVTDGFWYDVGSIEKYEKLDNGSVERHFSFLYDLSTPRLRTVYVASNGSNRIIEDSILK